MKKHWYKVRIKDPIGAGGRSLMLTCEQDMHYAEFAEDEVCRSPTPVSVADTQIESGSSQRDQGIRDE